MNHFEIILAKKSRLSSTDLSNVGFGTVFTDHMMTCDYKNGQWHKPKITPYAPITLDPSAKVFHYGQAVFEGMKAYKSPDKKIWLFRPLENIKRMNLSAERMRMPSFDEAIFMEGLHHLLNVDKSWLLETDCTSIYIRPFMIATEPCVSANAATDYKLMVICSPVTTYYSSAEVNVVFAEKYSRAASGGVGFAKCAGNYGAQFYPTDLAIEEGYEQIIWTDSATHSKLEEAGTMNIFFRVGEELFTAPTSDTILNGVTRKSILTLCERMNIKTTVKEISVKEIVVAAENGTLKEMFGTGTAVVVCPINSFGYGGKNYKIPTQKDPFAHQLKTALTDIQNKIAEDPFNWTVEVIKK